MTSSVCRAFDSNQDASAAAEADKTAAVEAQAVAAHAISLKFYQAHLDQAKRLGILGSNRSRFQHGQKSTDFGLYNLGTS